MRAKAPVASPRVRRVCTRRIMWRHPTMVEAIRTIAMWMKMIMIVSPPAWFKWFPTYADVCAIVHGATELEIYGQYMRT